MSLTGSAALSLFSTSKETRKKKREAKGGERQKGSERERARGTDKRRVRKCKKRGGGAEGYRVESG